MFSGIESTPAFCVAGIDEGSGVCKIALSSMGRRLCETMRTGCTCSDPYRLSGGCPFPGNGSVGNLPSPHWLTGATSSIAGRPSLWSRHVGRESASDGAKKRAAQGDGVVRETLINTTCRGLNTMPVAGLRHAARKTQHASLPINEGGFQSKQCSGLQHFWNILPRMTSMWAANTSQERETKIRAWLCDFSFVLPSHIWRIF